MNQFNGPDPGKRLQRCKKAKTKAGDIEAITGATITSRAATNGVSDAVAIVRAIIEGGI
jgi:electron transport complex protein RnfG